MDFMEKITELRAKKGQLLTQAQALVDEGKIEEANEFTSQMEAINTSIAGLEALAKASQEGAEPVYDGALHGGKPKDEGKGEDKPFTSLGEQLQAVYNFRKNHVEDKRLQRVNNAVLGVNEGSGADGGFVIQTDFAGMILESAVQQSPLLNRLDRYTCSSAANAMRWISVDETDVSKSVFGGIQMYWAAEGATVADSKPRFREMKMDLEKMMGFLYCTDEMLSDSAFMSSFAGPSFALAADRLLTESSISGDGVGKPPGPAPLQGADRGGQGGQPGGGYLRGRKRDQDAGPGHAQGPGAAGVADAPRPGGAASLSVHPERRDGQVPVEPRGRPGQLRHPAGAQQAGAVRR